MINVMEEKKRKQHYVFQAYLRAWSTNGKIWCLRNKCDIFCTSSINIAQERDFYRIYPINADEIKFYDECFLKKSDIAIKKAMHDFIENYIAPIKYQNMLSELKQYIKKCSYHGRSLPSGIKKDIINLDKIIDAFTNNVMEDYLSRIECDGVKYIKILIKKDNSFYYPKNSEQIKNRLNDIKLNFLYFISVQYFRTKAARERAIATFNRTTENVKIFKEKIRFKNLYPIFTWQFQTNLAYSLMEKNAHLTILTNATSHPFITSDQPVINLEADYQNLTEGTVDFIFYYPISPEIAITVNDKNKKDIINLSVSDVDIYNEKIFKASYESIYANNKEILEHYHNYKL